MKKVISFLLICMFTFCFSLSALAAPENVSLKYILDAKNSTVDASGNNIVTVKPGDIVTVTYVIENTSSGDDAETATTQNQIKYDHNFFEMVDNSIILNDEVKDTFSTSCPIDSDKNQTHYVFFNSVSSLSIYSSEKYEIGSFQLKVVAKTGSSTIVNTQYKATDSAAELFVSEKQDLVVIIEGSERVSVTDISLDKTAMTLFVPDSETLLPTIVPSNATDREIIWTSDNPAVASVNDAGTVKANSVGIATITATTEDGGKTATCTVTVVKEDLPIDEEIPPETEQSTEIPDEPDEPVTSDTPSSNPFLDVKSGEYYYDAVLWAAENEITQGTGAKTFSPDMPVIRAQVVTFLWRAAGCPEPTGDASKFTDVEVGSYYEKAVAWAIEQGITKGTSETTFSPDKICTRGQIVTFLARFAGVEDDATGYTHSFTDVKATDFYNNAVAWAKDNGVTEGTSATTFSPNDDCTRGQIVTFLYRWMVR